MLYRLLGEVVGLWEAIQGQALMGANRELGEQCHQDGFHHHHGDVLTNTGTRARAERLEVTTRGLNKDSGEGQRTDGTVEPDGNMVSNHLLHQAPPISNHCSKFG